MHFEFTINTLTHREQFNNNNVSEHNIINIMTYSRLTLLVTTEAKSFVFQLHIIFRTVNKSMDKV